jgi:hypothetical protein
MVGRREELDDGKKGSVGRLEGGMSWRIGRRDQLDDWKYIDCFLFLRPTMKNNHTFEGPTWKNKYEF